MPARGRAGALSLAADLAECAGSQPTWFNAPVTEHSRKPAEQFAIIERVSQGPFLELFARRRPDSRQDWRVWGDEIDSDIAIPGYPVPSDRAAMSEEADAQEGDDYDAVSRRS